MMVNSFRDPQWAIFGLKQRGFAWLWVLWIWCDFAGFRKNRKVPRKVRLHGVAWGPVIFSWTVTLSKPDSEPTTAQNEYFGVF